MAVDPQTTSVGLQPTLVTGQKRGPGPISPFSNPPPPKKKRDFPTYPSIPDWSFMPQYTDGAAVCTSVDLVGPEFLPLILVRSCWGAHRVSGLPSSRLCGFLCWSPSGQGGGWGADLPTWEVFIFIFRWFLSVVLSSDVIMCMHTRTCTD